MELIYSSYETTRLKNRFFYFVLFLSTALWGCSEDTSVENDGSETKSIEQVKKDIVGVWEGMSQLVIIDSDSISFCSKVDMSEIYEKIEYNIFDIDSLSTKRPHFIEEKYKSSKHELVFFNKDSILIKQFIPVIYGISGFDDITLVRKKTFNNK